MVLSDISYIFVVLKGGDISRRTLKIKVMEMYKFRTVATRSRERINIKDFDYRTYKGNGYAIGKDAVIRLVGYAMTLKGQQNWEELKSVEKEIINLGKGASMDFIVHEDTITGQRYRAILLTRFK